MTTLRNIGDSAGINNHNKHYRTGRQVTSKIITLGDSSVGKTSIVKRYIQGDFNTTSQTTIGVDFFKKTIEYGDRELTLRFWDTAGQELYNALTHHYLRDAHLCILVYSVNSKASFLNLTLWENVLRKRGNRPLSSFKSDNDDNGDDDDDGDDDNSILVILVGNKLDTVISGERRVSIEEGRAKAKEMGDIPFFEVSAKNGENIQELFETITEMIIRKNQVILNKPLPPPLMHQRHAMNGTLGSKDILIDFDSVINMNDHHDSSTRFGKEKCSNSC